MSSKIWALILCSIIWANQTLLSQACITENKAFLYGERVDYTIYYYLAGIWVGAGDVYFEVDSQKINKQRYYHIKSFGKTYKKYDWIYEVRDSYQSLIQEENFLPYRFKRNVNEGSTYIREDYLYKHEQKRVITKRQMEEDEPLVTDTIPLAKCSFDVLSMIYYARNIDFTGIKEGDKVPINILLDNSSHPSYIRYLGKKVLRVKGAGLFRCILFSPLLIEGTIFTGGEEMTVWVTDDENKVPLYIETPILVGSIRARINSMKGLRYPLKSKIGD